MNQVVTPAGSKYPVKDRKLQNYYNDLKNNYLTNYKFEDAADLESLHELIMCHVFILELTQELAEDDAGIKPHQIHETILNYKKQIVVLQDSLCISAKAREKNSEQSNVSEYLTQLLQRAKHFNISREKQYERAKEIINEIKTMLRMDKVCNEEEKRIVGILSPQAIFKRIEDMISEYDKIDEPMIEEQKNWGIAGDEM